MTEEQTHDAVSPGSLLTSSFSPSWVKDQVPHTSLVIACYKVSAYLPAFFASLEAQTSDHTGTELIFVIDGCPEASEAIVSAWMQHTDYPVHLITKPNGGAASARNAGIAVARGTWVAAPDPDDVLEPDYLREIEREQSAHPRETMFVGRICLTAPDGSAIEHPLDYKNRAEQTRVVDLSEDPDALVTQGAVTFLNTAHLRSQGLRMREDLVTGEDTDFIVRYLLAVGARYVLVPEARYRYQRRADESSIVKTQEKNIDRYRVLFGSSYPALLDQAGPQCPQWLANMLLYFVFYLFDRNRSAHAAVYATDEATLAEIREALRGLLERIGPEQIDAFRVHNLPLDMRAAWLAAAAAGDQGPDTPLPVTAVERHDYNEARGLLRVSFTSVDAALPAALRTYDANTGEPLEIVAHKTRAIEYLGATWAYEHVLLVRTAHPDAVRLVASEAAFALNGAALPVWAIRNELGHSKPTQPSPPAPLSTSAPPSTSGGLRQRLRHRLRHRLRRLKYALPRRLATATGRARRYQAAVLFDLGSGSQRATDPTLEGLFAAAVADPGTNAWGLIAADDPRRTKFRAAGMPVVVVGSQQHLLLLTHAVAVVSLRLDYPQPFPADMVPKKWRFVYLPPAAPGPHDYWHLLPWDIDLIAADSEGEAATLAGDGGPYWFNQCEVLRLSGYRAALSEFAPGAHEVAPGVRLVWSEALDQGVVP